MLASWPVLFCSALFGGPDRARAAEQRGAAMSMAAAAEYALTLTAPGRPLPGPGRLGSPNPRNDL